MFALELDPSSWPLECCITLSQRCMLCQALACKCHLSSSFCVPAQAMKDRERADADARKKNLIFTKGDAGHRPISSPQILLHESSSYFQIASISLTYKEI